MPRGVPVRVSGIVTAFHLPQMSSRNQWIISLLQPLDCVKGTCTVYPHFFDPIQLYDLEQDPTEQINLMNSPYWNDTLLPVYNQLMALINCHDQETHPLSPASGVCAAVNSSLVAPGI